MVVRRSAYAFYVGLISLFVLAGVLSAGGPAQGGVRPAPAPDEKVATGPAAVTDEDLSPRRVNVQPGARPPVASRKQSKAACGGGVVQLGKIYSCASLSANQQDVFTVTTSVDGDVLYGTVTETANNDVTDSVSAMLYDADGNYLCYFGTYPGGCELGAAGTYTVVVALSYGSGDMAYTLALQSQRTPSSCRTLGNAFFSFASAGRTAELARGSAGECYTFDQPTGSVLQMYAPQASKSWISYFGLSTGIHDRIVSSRKRGSSK